MRAAHLPALLAALTLMSCNAADEGGISEAVRNGQVEASPAQPAVKAGANQSEPVDLNALEPDAQPQAETPPDPSLVTRQWFAGRWTDTGDCADAGEFAASGIFLLADGTRGMWNVIEGQLVIQNARGRGVFQLRRVDDSTVELVNPDGSIGRSTRC